MVVRPRTDTGHRRGYITCVAILTPFALWGYLYFGQVLPLTVGAKMQQGAIGVHYIPGAVAYISYNLGPIFGGPIFLGFAAAGLALIRPFRFLWPVIAWT